MTRPRRRADLIFEADYLTGLEDRSIQDLRKMRDECEAFEAEISYARRLLQGKLDILRHEIDRRREGGESGVEALIERLPKILADDGARGFGRHTRVGIPQGAEQRRREVERLASESSLAHLDELPQEELSGYVDTLAEAEAKASQERRQILEVIDRITTEMVRRYREGHEDPAAIPMNR